MGNDMYNDEQLAHLRSEARRRENQSQSGVLARESFLRHLHSLADATVSADSLHPSEVALAEHDAALRSRSLPPEVEAAAEALREARERYRKPGGHYLTDDLRAERRRLGKLTDDLLAALSSARSAAPARDEVREAAEALRATHAEIARLDERDVASSYTALRALLPRALRDGKALLAALPRDAKGGE